MSSEVTRRRDREEAHVDVAMSMQNEVSWKGGGLEDTGENVATSEFATKLKGENFFF